MKHCDQIITFDDDKLGRDKYADFLIELARNAESEEGSYTIAVNAPYGSGKTTLLKMMCSEIKVKYATTKIKNPLTVVYYNAWRYDFFHEPLVPLAASLFEQDELADRNAFNKMIKAAKFIAFLSNGVLNHFKGLDIYDAYQKAKSTSDSEKEFSQYGKAIDELCDALREAVQEYGNNAKMLVIIDELDRCRPDFAIQTLEITKHLLTNKNIVFMYALDMGQLQKAVENAYGIGMDSAGYLLRFFDYITTIPEPDRGTYIKATVNKIETEPYFSEDVSKEMEFCCTYFSMSLRDIDRILSAYEQMSKYFLGKYENVIARRLYLHLLCMKYKKRDRFEELIGMKSPENYEYFRTYWKENEEDVIGRIIERLCYKSNSLISIHDGRIWFKNNLEMMINGKPISVSKGQIALCGDTLTVYSMRQGFPARECLSKNDVIVGNVLFPEDIPQVIAMKPSSVLEYLHRRMEFFDFETGLHEKQGTE